MKNATPYAPVLARGRVHEDAWALSLNLDVWFALGSGGALSELETPPEAVPADPPDIKGRPLWKGTSVTAVGAILGPKTAPYAKPVRLVVGEEEVRLAVFGPRVWEGSRFGRLAPSQPGPFDEVPMSWALAFGGSYDLPPGLLPGTELPHPGGRVVYPLNPDGRGFWSEDARALGQPLPQIELATDLIDRPDRWAEPLALAPSAAPALALHLQAIGRNLQPRAGQTALPIAETVRHSFSLQHFAPPRCVFAPLAAGSRVVVEGVGERRVELRVPTTPIEVRLRRGKSVVTVAGAPRAVHVDVGRSLALVSYGHSCLYAPREAPDWVHVERMAS